MIRSVDSMDIHTGITSRPMPSPGIKPIRNNLEAIRLKNCLQSKVGSEVFFKINNISSAGTVQCDFSILHQLPRDFPSTRDSYLDYIIPAWKMTESWNVHIIMQTSLLKHHMYNIQQLI